MCIFVHKNNNNTMMARHHASTYTVRGKILEGENFGESMILKLLARKNLANLPAKNLTREPVSSVSVSSAY